MCESLSEWMLGAVEFVGKLRLLMKGKYFVHYELPLYMGNGDALVCGVETFRFV